MNEVFLSVGSNMGNKNQNLINATGLIASEIGKIERISAVYETEPWGKKDQADFLNQVLLVQSALSAAEVLQKALDIEQKMGRIRDEEFGARTIDIDVLLYNDEIIDQPQLTVPHPHMHERNFVLIPFNEIAADKIHPVFNKNIKQLTDECRDAGVVKLQDNLHTESPAVDTNLE